jgi:hypothetical protein
MCQARTSLVCAGASGAGWTPSPPPGLLTAYDLLPVVVRFGARSCSPLFVDHRSVDAPDDLRGGVRTCSIKVFMPMIRRLPVTSRMTETGQIDGRKRRVTSRSGSSHCGCRQSLLQPQGYRRALQAGNLCFALALRVPVRCRYFSGAGETRLMMTHACG